MKNVIGGSLILLQLFLIVNARFIPAKYFCWAPHDEQNVYELAVTINKKVLTQEEINKRYHLEAGYYWVDSAYQKVNIEARSIENVKDLVAQYESTYGKLDQADVKLTYWRNGGNAQHWRWPKDHKYEFKGL